MDTEKPDGSSRIYIISKQFQTGEKEIVFQTAQVHGKELTKYPYSKHYKDEENQLLKCEQCVHVHNSKNTGQVDEIQEQNDSSEKQDDCKIISTGSPLPITILHSGEVSTKSKELLETRIDIDTETPEVKEETFWLEYKAKVKDVLQEFAGETTAHGYKRTISTRRAVQCRIVWVFAILSVVLTLAKIIDFLVPDMRSFSTSIKSEPGRSVPFPAVTVCNLAPYDTSRINGTPLQEFTSELMHLFTKDSIFTDVTVNTSRLVPDILDTKTLSDLIGWGIDRFLLNCTLFMKTVNCSDIFTRTMSGSDSCFSFNLNPENIVYAEQRGSYSSLHLVLDIGHVMDPFSSVTPAGIKVILHNSTDHPNTHENGMLVAPDASVLIAVDRRKYTFLSRPYKAYGTEHCVDYDDVDSPVYTPRFYNHTGYSWCLAECRLSHILKVCNCLIHAGDPPVQNVSICSIEKFKACYLTASRNFQIKSPFNNTDCACPLPCNKVEYTGRISTAAFPNYNKNSNQKRGSRVEIKIYYDHLLTLTEEQIRKYSWPDLFGSIGGMIGLFTGASVLTLLEFVELMALCGWVSLKMLFSNTSFKPKNRSKPIAHVNKSFC